MKKSPGFTLIELVMAALLLTGLMSLIFAALTTANKILNAEQGGLAYYLARNRIERLHEAVRHDWWSDAYASHPLTVKTDPLPTPWEFVWINYKTHGWRHDVYTVAGRDYRRVDADVQW